MALNYTTVTGTFKDGSGAPLSGTVTFTPSQPVYAAGVPLVTPAAPVQAEVSGGQLLSSSGSALKLLATDNSGITLDSQTGFWFWTVTVSLASASGAPIPGQQWSFFLPSSPATVELYATTNTAASGGGGITLPAGDLGGTNASPTVVGTHLASPLPVAQGGTGQATQQAAIDALAGAQTAGQFLRGNGTHVVMSAVQAADVPQLAQYNPVGLTGAEAPTSYAGGTFRGHPLYGTWSQGQWVVDQTGEIYVCVTGGTPGTWRRAAAMPYMFFLDDYCRGDGRMALVTTVAGSAVINTTPLGAPAAPAPTTAATGGTILAGVYGVIVTYTNRWGETVGSTAGTVTTTGSTSTITVPAPSFTNSGNATGWNAYVTQPGGSTYYRQQAAGSPTSMGVPLILTAPPTTSGANPPGADTSAAQVFSPVTTPAVPASGTPYTSTYNYPVPVTITGGAVTSVVISGIGQVGTGPGTYTLPPLQSITLTYTSAPAWTWASPDVSKNAMICGGLGSPGAPWIDTIASVQSLTQATLSSNGAGQGGNVSQAGCAMVFSSDDRLAVDQCISDARAYALVNDNFCQVIGNDRIYGLGSGFFQSTGPAGTNPGANGLGYNTQVRIPVGIASNQAERLESQILGPGDNAHCYMWTAQFPALEGCCFVSYSLGPTSPDATYGQQSIVGGPQAGPNANGSNGFLNAKAVIRGVQAVQPGWSNSIGFDFQRIAGFVLRGSSQAFAPTTSTGGGVNPSNGWVSNTFWQSKIGAGLRTPNEQNNDDCVIESFATEGITTSVLTGCDHLIIHRLATINTYFGINITGGDLNTHDLTILQWSFENVSGGVLENQSGGHIKVHIQMDGENLSPLYDIKDTGNNLYGIVYWSDPFRTAGGLANVAAPIVQGAANLEIINGQVTRGVYDAHAYAYTLGTAFQNPWWRHVDVELAGGTVTAVKTGPAATSLTTRATTSGRFRLPSGWWMEIDGSVKPTTFLADTD